MIEPSRIVKVVWVDSSSPGASAWISAEEASSTTDINCISLGWLLVENEDKIVLVSSLAPTDDKGTFDVSGVITIPKVAVVSISDLKVSKPKTTRKSSTT